MVLSNRSLMGAEQPSLQQGNHAMNSRKQVFSLFLMALYLAIMDISSHPPKGGQTVGQQRASRRNSLSDEPVKPALGTSGIEGRWIRAICFRNPCQSSLALA